MPLIQRLQSKLNPNLVRLLAYLKPHKGKLLMSVFFMIGAGAGSSLIALLLGKLTDEQMIRETSVEGRRRTYAVTEAGQRLYDNELARLRRCVRDADREEDTPC